MSGMAVSMYESLVQATCTNPGAFTFAEMSLGTAKDRVCCRRSVALADSAYNVSEAASDDPSMNAPGHSAMVDRTSST